MNRKKSIGWLIILVVAAFGITSAKAQINLDKTPKTWRITTKEFILSRSGEYGNSFRLDSKGNFEKQIKDHKETAILDETILDKIEKLLRQLNLPDTKTEKVKGKGFYDYSYSSFIIELDGKSYLLDGVSFFDAEYLVLSAEQWEIFGELKGMLSETGCNPLKPVCKPNVKISQ